MKVVCEHDDLPAIVIYEDDEDGCPVCIRNVQIKIIMTKIKKLEAELEAIRSAGGVNVRKEVEIVS